MAPAPVRAWSSDPWQLCRERLDPVSLDGYRCHLEVARRLRDWDEAVRRLESLRRREETRPGASLYLGRVEADRGRPGAVALYEEAAEEFARRGHAEGEVLARAAAVGEYATRHLNDEAERHAARAWAVAEASRRPDLRARALLARSRAATLREEISSAWSLARRAEGLVGESDPLDLRIELRQALGSLRWMQERHAEALAEYRRGLELAEQSGDAFEAAMLRYSVAFLEVNRASTAASSAPGALDSMRAALAAARRAGNLGAELRCLLVLGQAGDDAAPAHLRRAAELAERLGDFERGLFATRFYAYTLDPSDPAAREEIARSFSRALEVARSRGSLEHEILAQIGFSTALRAMGEPERSLVTAESAFDAIERGRQLQRIGAVRAGWQSRFGFFYKRIAGWLLEAPLGQPVPADRLVRSLEVMERLRGRVLLEALEAPFGGEPAGDGHLSVLRAIVAVQRSLRDARLTEGERRQHLAHLDRLEAEESAVRSALPGSPDRRTPGSPPPQLDLEAIRQLLRPDEAIATFQLHGRALRPGWTSDGGSWLVLLTRDGYTVRALADQAEIEAASFVYLGLLGRDDAMQRGAAARLHRLLFGDSLGSLPVDCRRLILVLDPVLEALPLGTLRPRPDSAPLADRLELSRSPSLAAFRRLRSRDWPLHAVPALALADPASEGRDASASRAVRSAFGSLGDALTPLPFARTEASALQRSLGGGSDVRRGSEATESGLKATDLGRYAILHLGAHAIVDEAHPERSAVLLAPGGEDEDGLLQPRDIEALGLDGQLVVLAACRTLAGQLVPSEGAMGLGRAFLARGARTVVASLWPMQDDLAADLFIRFYRGLAGGATVGAALQGAQRELRDAGVPARGWAGVVVLGDAAYAPAAAPGDAAPPSWPLALVLAVAVLVLARRVWPSAHGTHPG